MQNEQTVMRLGGVEVDWAVVPPSRCLLWFQYMNMYTLTYRVNILIEQMNSRTLQLNWFLKLLPETWCHIFQWLKPHSDTFINLLTEHVWPCTVSVIRLFFLTVVCRDITMALLLPPAEGLSLSTFRRLALHFKGSNI